MLKIDITQIDTPSTRHEAMLHNFLIKLNIMAFTYNQKSTIIGWNLNMYENDPNENAYPLYVRLK